MAGSPFWCNKMLGNLQGTMRGIRPYSQRMLYPCFIRWSSPINMNILHPPSMRLATFSV